ncbi:MAG: M1 family metallopeptidase [Bacteroidota bacterium]
MKKLFIACYLLSVVCFTFSQTFPSNSYRSVSNPHYWKNHSLSSDGYWQQDVHYKIKANIDEKTDIISATEELIYYNNSPDTLFKVYFHLYQNAFQPGSYRDKLLSEKGTDEKYGHYEKQKKNTEVLSLLVNGMEVETNLDNTIMEVNLKKPLLPKDSCVFQIIFKTYFESQRSAGRRMKMFDTYGNKHYNGVHWYPRICVYDRKFGWDTYQHLGKEFYGDFGTYDVELSFANNFVVEATGNLLNSSEVLPDELRQKLDIKNFKNKPIYSSPSVITPYDSTQRKSWKYYAENVHDFAFTADPTYRIGEAQWNGIKCIALAQEPIASLWQNAAEYTAKVIKVYSEDIGMYIYPKIIVADARDGMEYPMLTLCGGFDPNYRTLIAHEVGHNWFFGIIGNNETYRALLDEGFTEFLTCWALEKIDGKELIEYPPASRYVREFIKPNIVRNNEAHLPYLMDKEGTVISKHSDDFNTSSYSNGGYRQVYCKTATMLYNLQYVLGDDLFLNAMKHYFEEWKVRHPYPEDFRNSIIQFTHVDLNWFFDQWLETSKTIDYKIKNVKQVKSGDNKDEYLLTFQRKGKMQMPIDFTVLDRNDDIHNFHIPNTWFIKKTDAAVLPKWYGWDKIQPAYQTIVKIPAGIKSVVIDPTNRLADSYMPDNRLPKEISYSFDSKIYNPPDWTHYELFARPDLWYNGYDGIKAGVNLNGNFMYCNMFDVNLWANSGLAQNLPPNTTNQNDFNSISFRVNYETPINFFSTNSSVYCSIKKLDGLNSYRAEIDKHDADNKNRVYVFLKSMIRRDYNDLNYLLYPKEWEKDMLNNTIKLGYEHNYSYKQGTGQINLALSSSTLMSDYDYANINLVVVNQNHFGKINFNTRTYLQYGTGKNTPKESSLYLAGANPEELMENKFTRSIGLVPNYWTGYGATTNYFQQGGGLNLRGYAGYLVPYPDKNGNVKFIYRGTSGAAFNAELEFGQLFNFINVIDQNGIVKWIKNTFNLNTYLFGDIGVINCNSPNEKFALAPWRADAGVGTALTIKKFGPLQTVEPLTIRFDMPLFLNKIPAVESDYFKFRWVIGVSRAF